MTSKQIELLEAHVKALDAQRLKPVENLAKNVLKNALLDAKRKQDKTVSRWDQPVKRIAAA